MLRKVMHVPFCFYPDPVGGTEVYVESLGRELQQRGLMVTIAARGSASESYSHGALAVHRFGVRGGPVDPRDLYGQGDLQAAAAFGQLLDDEEPDVVHLHAFTRGASLRLVRESK